MAEPNVLNWLDLGYVVEVKTGALGLGFQIWVAFQNKDSGQLYFAGRSGDFVGERSYANAICSGIISKTECLDIMFEYGVTHFCSQRHAGNMGLVFERLCSLAKDGVG